MINPELDEIRPPVNPPGIEDDFLISPQYVSARGWGLYCIDDRLSFPQLHALVDPRAGQPSSVYGYFSSGFDTHSVRLSKTVQAISEFFVEMVGGDACVFDLPNSFLITVLDGDITLVERPKLEAIFGAATMGKSDWIAIARDLRSDIKERILNKYTREQSRPSLSTYSFC
jgi:hypothetical protein